MDVTFRLATAADLESLALLMQQCFPQDYPEVGLPNKWIRERLASEFAAVYVAVDGEGALCAYAVWILLGAGSGVAEFDELGVHPGRRGRGFARRLIFFGEEHFKMRVAANFGFAVSRIFLKSSTEAVIHLGVAMGFRIVATVPDMFHGRTETLLIKSMMGPPGAAVLEFPRRRMAAGLHIRDSSGRILLVKPTYREGWLVPGGLVELGETPARAVTRESEEELGLPLIPQRLLCIDVVTATADVPEGLMFLFDGGLVSDFDIASIVLDNEEISEMAFVDRETSLQLVASALRHRLASAWLALDVDRTLYLHDGMAALEF